MGAMRLMVGGFAGLWRHFELWEVAIYMRDMSDVHVATDYTFQDRREVHGLLSAVRNSMWGATKLDVRKGHTYSLIFASFAFDCGAVEDFLRLQQHSPEANTDEQVSAALSAEDVAQCGVKLPGRIERMQLTMYPAESPTKYVLLASVLLDRATDRTR